MKGWDQKSFDDACRRMGRLYPGIIVQEIAAPDAPKPARKAKPDRTAADALRLAQAQAAREKLERKFSQVWHALGGPALERQHEAVPGRKWRFDFAHVATRVAVEIDGGTWNRGGHVRGLGYRNDREKDNAATLLGWRVFRLTGDMIDAGNVQPILDFVRTKTEGVK